jgi:hypothetical protein
LGWTRSRYARVESDALIDVGLEDVCVAASVLGREVSVGLHPTGAAVRDAGQLHLGQKLRGILNPAFRALSEVLLPRVGDRRSWDMLLRLRGQVIGVELETRIRDVQWLVRRLRERERDGGVDLILLVLSDSATNRRLLRHLLDNLGPDWQTSPRVLLRSLRNGEPITGSGVVLL